MALFWPDAGVALEVVDDPTSTPFTGDEDVQVLRVSSEELDDSGELEAFVCRLADALDEEVPDGLEDARDRDLWLRSLIGRAVVS